jgi:hypothetical protein
MRQMNQSCCISLENPVPTTHLRGGVPERVRWKNLVMLLVVALGLMS